jgi:hypothetical protein
MNITRLVLRIFLGDKGDYPRLISELPGLGIFRVDGTDNLMLSYATDDSYYRNREVKAAQGFLTRDGIGAITQRADFKFGGGATNDSQLTIRLRCTDDYLPTLDGYGIELIGNRVVILEYTETGVGAYSERAIYGGTIQGSSYGETVLTLSVIPRSDSVYTFPLVTEREYRDSNSNVTSTDRSAAIFGKTKYARYMRIGEEKHVTRLGNITVESVGGTGNYWPVMTYQRDSEDNDLKDLPWNEQKFLIRVDNNAVIDTAAIENQIISDFDIQEDIGLGGVYIEVNTSSEKSPVDRIEELNWFGDKYLAIIPRNFINMTEFASTITLTVPNLKYRGDAWPTEEVAPIKWHGVVNDKLLKLDIAAKGNYVDGDTFLIPKDIYIYPVYPIDNDIYNIVALIAVQVPHARGIADIHALHELDPVEYNAVNDDTFPRRYGPMLSRYFRSLSRSYRFVKGRAYGSTSAYYGDYSVYTKRTQGLSNVLWRVKSSRDVINSMNAINLQMYNNAEYDVRVFQDLPTGNYTPLITSPIVVRLPDIPQEYRDIDMSVYLHVNMLIQKAVYNNYDLNDDYTSKAELHAFDSLGNYVRLSATREPTPAGLGARITFNNMLNIRDGAFALDEYSANFYDHRIDPDRPIPNEYDVIVPGYKNYSLDGIDFSTNAKKELLIFSQGRGFRTDNPIFRCDIYQMGIVGMIHVDVSNGILLPSMGRVFGDIGTAKTDTVWENRKSASDHIDNPVDIIEHILRQYERDRSSVVDNMYARDRVGIATETFDGVGVSKVKTKTVSRCIDEAGDSESNVVIGSLYRDYYLTNKDEFDAKGNTRYGITHIKNKEGVTAIDRKDLMNEVVITNPSAQDIYCEPIIKYGYVSGKGYTQEMSVSRINMPEWRPEYTTGLDEGIREAEDNNSPYVVIGGREWMTVDFEDTTGVTSSNYVEPDGEYSVLRNRPTQQQITDVVGDGWRLPTLDDINALAESLPLDSQGRPDARPIMSASWGGTNTTGANFIPVGVGRTEERDVLQPIRVRSGEEGVWWLEQAGNMAYNGFRNRFKIHDNTISLIINTDIDEYPFGGGAEWKEELFAVRLVRDAQPPEPPEVLPNGAKALWDYCHKIFTKYNDFAEMPNELVEQKWIGDYGEDFGFQSTSYKYALNRMYEILEWMQNSRTTVKVPWEVGRHWYVGQVVSLSVPHYYSGREMICAIESLTKTFYGTTPNVEAGLVIIDDGSNLLRDADTIDEGGNRSIIIDEAATREILIDESGSRGRI